MYEKSQDTTSDDSSCGCNCSHAVKMTHQNVQTFVGDIEKLGTHDKAILLQQSCDDAKKPESDVKTGIYIGKQYHKTDISPILYDLAQIYDEMTIMTTKLHKITSEPTYSFSFHESDFYNVVKRWKEMTDRRDELLGKITGHKQIYGMTEYIADLCMLSKLNEERTEIVKKLIDVANRSPLNGIVTALQAKLVACRDELAACKDELEALKSEHAPKPAPESSTDRIQSQVLERQAHFNKFDVEPKTLAQES